MKRILFSLIAFFIVAFSSAQSPQPSGFPAPYSTGYYRIGWLQDDSGRIPSVRTDTFPAKYIGTEFYWPRSGIDTSMWIWNGLYWLEENGVTSFNNRKGKVILLSSDVTTALGFTPLGNITNYIQAGSNVNFTGLGTLASPYVINSSGGGGGGSVTSFGFTNGNGFTGTVSNNTTTPVLSMGTSLTGIISGNGTGLGTVTIGSGLSYSGGVLSATGGTSLNGLIYGTGSAFAAASVGAGLSFSGGTLTNTINNTNQLTNGAAFLQNITSLISAGTNVTISGSGTSGSPYVITATGGGGGSGTVTTFSAGTLAPLFTTSVSNPTTIPGLSFTLSNATANSVFGNNTGSSAVPVYYVPTSTTLNGWFGGTIQSAISLTTTGTGSPTFTSNVLNIPPNTLTYTQNALNNTIAINPGNTQTFLPATHFLEGLMDTASKAVADSLRLRTYTWPSYNLYVSNYGASGLGTIFSGGTPFDSIIGKKLIGGTNVTLTQNADSSITISASGGSSISLTTTGTSGAATYSGGTLNIPQYQGAITLTTTGSSGAATLTGTTLNIPQYSGGGSQTFQQVLTTGSTMTGANTVTMSSNNFTWSGGTGIFAVNAPMTSNSTVALSGLAYTGGGPAFDVVVTDSTNGGKLWRQPYYPLNVSAYPTNTVVTYNGSGLVLGPGGSGSFSLTTTATGTASNAPTLVSSVLNIDTLAYGKIFNIRDFGAKPDGRQSFTFSTTASSTSATCSNCNFIGARDNGKSIRIDGAGAGGAALVTTFTVVNSTTVTLGSAAGTSGSSLKGVYGTDNTSYFQLAINAAGAVRGAEVWVPSGWYIIAGALQTSVNGGANPNSQLYMPSVESTTGPTAFGGQWIGITIQGEFIPQHSQQPIGDTAFKSSGSVIYSIIDGSVTGNIEPSVIGNRSADSYNSGENGVDLVVKNLTIMVPAGGLIGGINGFSSSTTSVYDCNILDDFSGSYLSHPQPVGDVAAIVTAGINKEVLSTIDNVWISGFKYGIITSDHAQVKRCSIFMTTFGRVFSTSEEHQHDDYDDIQWTKVPVYLPASTICSGMIPVVKNYTYFSIDHLGMELFYATGQWNDVLYTISDSSNYGRGEIHYDLAQAGFGNTPGTQQIFSKYQSDSIWCYNIGQPLSGSGGGSIDATLAIGNTSPRSMLLTGISSTSPTTTLGAGIATQTISDTNNIIGFNAYYNGTVFTTLSNGTGSLFNGYRNGFYFHQLGYTTAGGTPPYQISPFGIGTDGIMYFGGNTSALSAPYIGSTMTISSRSITLNAPGFDPNADSILIGGFAIQPLSQDNIVLGSNIQYVTGLGYTYIGSGGGESINMGSSSMVFNVYPAGGSSGGVTSKEYTSLYIDSLGVGLGGVSANSAPAMRVNTSSILMPALSYSGGGPSFDVVITDSTNGGKVWRQPYYPLNTANYSSGKYTLKFSGTGIYLGADSGLVSPLTTTGDIIYSSSGSTAARLAIGSTGNFLTVSGGIPSWGSLPVAGASTAGIIAASGNQTLGPNLTLNGATTLVGGVSITGGILSYNSSNAPTIAAGAGAGTSPTVSISGTNICGTISVTTGAGPSTGAVVVTITTGTSFSNNQPVVSLTPANALTALLTGASMVYVGTSAVNNFNINSGTLALSTGTYKWNYIVIGY